MISRIIKRQLLLCYLCFFFFKQKTAYEIGVRLVGSEMCIRDRAKRLIDMANESGGADNIAVVIVEL